MPSRVRIGLHYFFLEKQDGWGERGFVGRNLWKAKILPIYQTLLSANIIILVFTKATLQTMSI